MKVTARELIELREKHAHRIEHLWCETQQNDIQEIIDLMEEVALAGIGASNPQGYAQLQQAKATFVQTLLDKSEKYRVVDLTYGSPRKLRNTDTHVG